MGKQLPLLPPMKCDEGCGACCGPVPCSKTEYNAVVALARKKGLTPIAQGMSCPFYQGGKCSVYEARPTMCRVFGHVPEMTCCNGHNVNVNPVIVQAMIKQSGARGHAVLLHDALVEFGVSESADEVIGPMGPLLRYAVNHGGSPI